MIEAKGDHSAKQQVMKVAVREHRRHRKLGVDIHDIEYVRICDQGQVHEFRDLAISQRRPDPIVFPCHLFFGGMWRPGLAVAFLVLDEYLYTAIASAQT